MARPNRKTGNPSTGIIWYKVLAETMMFFVVPKKVKTEGDRP